MNVKKVSTFVLIGFAMLFSSNGVWAATYYVRADGTAANKSAAIGPSSDAAACMSVTVHNAETFSSGDIILLSSRGGIIRGGIVPPTAGCIYKNVAGENVTLTSRRLVSTSWSESGGVYSTNVGVSIVEVFWAGASGDSWGTEITEDTSTPTTPADGKWGQSSTTIYYNPGTGQPVPTDSGAFFEFSINTDLSAFSSSVAVTLTQESTGSLLFTRSAYHGVSITSLGSDSTITGITATYNGNQTMSAGIGNGIQVSGLNCDVTGCTTQYNEDHGISVERTTGTPKPSGGTIDSCVCTYNKDAGIYVRGGADGNSSVTINKCVITSNGSEGEYTKAGIYFGYGSGDVYNSLINSNNGSGIGIRAVANAASASLNIFNCIISSNNTGDNSDAKDVAGVSIHRQFYGTITLYNNTIYGLGNLQKRGLYQYYFNADSVGPTLILKNNIMYGHSAFDIACEEGLDDNSSELINNFYTSPLKNVVSGTTYTNLAAWNSLSYVGTDSIGDPQFRSTIDFHLRSSSPCIDAGTFIGGLYSDYDGNLIYGQPDIGAYERQPGVISGVTHRSPMITPLISEIIQ